MKKMNLNFPFPTFRMIFNVHLQQPRTSQKQNKKTIKKQSQQIRRTITYIIYNNMNIYIYVATYTHNNMTYFYLSYKL